MPGGAFFYESGHFGPTSTPPSLKKNTWHLLAQSTSVSPASWNASEINPTPPSLNSVPTTLIQSLWAWSPQQQNWYYFAPSLQQQGIDECAAAATICSGLSKVMSEAMARGLLDFTSAAKSLGPNVGFWVRR